MGIWFASAQLADGEQVRYQSVGNSFRGRRSIGGQITITDQRLIFTPNRLDRLTGGHTRAISLDEIRGVHTLEPGREAVKTRGLAAAIRPQVEIDDGTGSPLVVTVREPDEIVRRLRPDPLIGDPGSR